jgi:para-aminobenzoate synthetase/4-amino-4-deoxychorismate lyase
MTAPEPQAFLFAEGRGARFLSFTRPDRILEAWRPEEVPEVLRAVDQALADGRFVAGYLAYEAAAAFGLRVREPDPQRADASGPSHLPLAWFGVYAPPTSLEIQLPPVAGSLPAPRVSLDAVRYGRAVARIQELIARGDTYQVNFTFPLETVLGEDPWALFQRLVAVQPVPYAAYLDLGRFVLASASPELFFEREGPLLRTRPMKGTAPRGKDLEDDGRKAEELRASAKDRAENLMIVDMLRNDLGRVAETGSVRVPALFEVERHPTLLQMTSRVEARSEAALSRVFEALFPCASVTGAPKRRTMEIIAELEQEPRGIYTGAIGWAGSGRACFSVAIRTAVADRERKRVRYSVGSGVVADSRAEGEYAECLLKGRILEEGPFELLETMTFLPAEGHRRLEGHLARLRRSATYFGVPLAGLDEAVEGALAEHARHAGPTRVRLLVDLFGRVRLESAPLAAPGSEPLRVGLARDPIDLDSPWLRHKTTRRLAYDRARSSRPDCDEVLLWNSRGEVTEASVWNVAVEGVAGALVTPPVDCGLLPGVERQALLAEGRVREGIVRVADLVPGQKLVLFNSVRGLCPATFVG